MSLRARLVGAVCVVALVALGSAGVATYTLFSQSQLRQIDDSLQRTHEPLEELVTSERGDDAGTVDDDDRRRRPARRRATRTWTARSSNSRPANSSWCSTPTERWSSVPAREPGHDPLTIDVADLTLPPEASGSAATSRRTPRSTADNGATEMRVRVSRLSDGSVLVIGLSMHEALESARGCVTIELIVAAISLIVAAVLGWLLVRVGLRPLRDVEQTALAIAVRRRSRS